MTAPLAWLYAIPVERFLSAYDATVANLSLLGIVSLWRVLLIIRVVSVVFRSHVLNSTTIVLLFADLILIPATGYVALATISVMGGIRVSEAEQLLTGITFTTYAGGLLTLPVWFFTALFVVGYGLMRWPSKQEFGVENGPNASEISRSVWTAAVSLLALGFILLLPTQGEQRRRYQAETLVKKGDAPAAVAFMSQFGKDDFPPHWDPPPRSAGDVWETPLIDIIEALVEADAPEWLWNIYRIKLDAGFSPIGTFYGPGFRPEAGGTDGEVVKRWIVALDKMSDGEQFTRDHARVFRDWLNDQQLTVEVKERVRVWMLRCDVKNPTPTNKRKDAID